MPAAYLLRRNNVYYYRRRIPVDCRAVFKKRELIISLRTTRHHQALSLLVDYNLWSESQFNRVRRGVMMDLSRISKFEEREKQNADGSRETTRRVDPAVIAALKDAGITPDKIAELVEGFLPPIPSTPAPNPISTVSSSSMTLSQLQESFNAWRKTEHLDTPDWTCDPGDETKLRRLIELLGANKQIQAITRENTNFVKSRIVCLPENTVVTRGMPIKKVIELSKDAGNYKTISSKQVNNHLTLYLSLFEYAITENYYTGINPFNKMRVKENKKRKNNALRNLFIRDELSSIFSHIIFTDYKTELKRTGKLKPYRFWTPLIGLYTGARPCEIGSLRVKDIKQVHGVWVFDFNEDGEGKCSKTANAIRKTPVHSRLRALGFIEYVESIKTQGHERIFPELEYEEGDGYGRYLNERFVGSILKPLGIYQRGKNVFYSFRHTLTTELHKCGVNQLHREQICGREAKGKTTGDEFYIKDEELPVLQTELEKIDFSKDLENVKPWV